MFNGQEVASVQKSTPSALMGGNVSRARARVRVTLKFFSSLPGSVAGVGISRRAPRREQEGKSLQV